MSRSSLLPSLVPKRAAGLEHAVEDTGELALLDPRGEPVLRLNDVDAIVWLLVNGRRSTREIASIVLDLLPAEPSRVQSDIEALLRALASRGFVELAA